MKRTSERYKMSLVLTAFRTFEMRVVFYILLTVHLEVILDNNQPDTLFLNVYFMPLYVSSNKCSSSGGPNCINTSSGITHSGGWVSSGPSDRPARHPPTKACYTR